MIPGHTHNPADLLTHQEIERDRNIFDGYESCRFCGMAFHVSGQFSYGGEHICRDCASSDDGHQYGAKVNYNVYYFETFLEAHDFALFWRGMVIDDEGKVITNFETLPF